MEIIKYPNEENFNAFDDKIKIISGALKEINYDVPIEIPKRYRRHFNIMNN